MKLAALITETRRMPNTPYIVRDHLDKLPECDLFVVCDGNENDFKGLKAKFMTARVRTLSDYNTLMTSMSLWTKLIAYDRVIVFQTDSKILREGLEEFYPWDYVGAPWKFQPNGGNGGLSLRNPLSMFKTIMRRPYHASMGYEDVYFSNNLVGKLAPREVCQKFSCETIFSLGTWGYHAISNYLSNEEIKQIENQYKEPGGISSGSHSTKMESRFDMGMRGKKII